MVERYIQDGSLVAKWVLFAVFAALFVIDAYFVITGQTAAVDQAIQQTFFSLRDDTLTAIVKGITFCGDTKTVGVLCIVLIILPGRLKIGLPIALAAGAGSLVHTAIKYLAGRPRPDAIDWLITEDGFSFPSGHANASLIFYLLLMIILGRLLIIQNNRLAAALLRILLIILVFLIGLSRIYLGVHYPSDVFGGWMLGGALLIVFLFIYDNLWPASQRINYDPPAWGAIPKNAEKTKGWRRPNKKRASGELLRFPKKRGPWRVPADQQKRRAQKAEAEAAAQEEQTTEKQNAPEPEETHTPLI
ncbi:MAG: phosphatase PAP2 family protein [Clostridiales Family XIII bacterium]|jgi:undecaprenyl-diphosphatase|nr:phosphatase PAP2 family protein [Clostridiales Family XIII bacterium]